MNIVEVIAELAMGIFGTKMDRERRKEQRDFEHRMGRLGNSTRQEPEKQQDDVENDAP